MKRRKPHDVENKSESIAMKRAAAIGYFVTAAFLFIPHWTSAQQPAVNPDIPFIPTPPEVVERMLSLAGVGPDDFVIDLGSGDGRILIAAAKLGARGFGVEIDPKLVRLANEAAVKAGVSLNISFIQQDLFATSLRAASVVAMYLPPQANFKLRPRLLSELNPGSRIVAHEFAMAGWLPDFQENVAGTDVYVWIVPARVAGEWNVRMGDREFVLQLKQLFQELTGVTNINGVQIPLGVARLRGDRIQLVLEGFGGLPLTLTGIVEGETMRAEPGFGENWTAKKK